MKHYEGKLGVFDYDENIWVIIKERIASLLDVDVLQLKEGYKGKISLPKGINSCYNMFFKKDLTGCWFEDFDTSDVEDMHRMFRKCTIPEGFSLGDKFDTSKVKDMDWMFEGCEMPKGFSLGNKFNTSSVVHMNHMFDECILPEGFSLGDKFDTSNVIAMCDMFARCEMPKGFSLGDKFDTSNVWEMQYMFYDCKMPEGFSLGDKFDTSNVKIMWSIFSDCKMPEGFSLGDKFDTSKVEDKKDLFKDCYIGSRKIKNADVETMKTLLEKLNSNSKNKQKGVLTGMIAHKLVENSTGTVIGVRLQLDNIGVYADTTVSCFKKLCKLKNISPKKGKDINVYKQGDTFISSGDESLVLEVQGFNLLDKLYCSDLKGNICVSDLNYSNTRDAHEKICSIISSIGRFNKIVFVYVPEKYSAYLKADIHFRTVEDIVDFVLSYYSKKMDKINVGSEKYPLSKETLMSIPKDKLNSIGDFSVELEDNGEGYVIIGFFSLSDEGYMLD